MEFMVKLVICADSPPKPAHFETIPPMKNITIEVPSTGTSIRFVLRSGASSSQAVIVAPDDVEVHVTELAPRAASGSKSLPVLKSGKVSASNAPSHDLDAILKRLLKLKPTKRVTAANSIKAMFQFDTPVSDEAANKILEDLRRRGSLTIDAKDKVQFRHA